MTTIYYGQGDQDIYWVPMDRDGIPRRVTSATYSISDLREAVGVSTRTVVASTAATAPSVSTTIGAAAGPSTAAPRRISVASATGLVVGGVYLLSDGVTQEAVKIARISGTDIELTIGLTRAFASGSTFQDMRLSGTFPSAVANAPERLDNGGGPFQVTWTYEIGDQLYVTWQELWITRYGLAPWVRPDELYGHLPGYEGVVGNKVSPEEAIRAATDELVADLQSGGAWSRDPAYYRSSTVAALYVRKRALVHMLRGSRTDGNLELARDFALEAAGHLANLTNGRPPTRSVSTEPYDDTAVAGGERVAEGGYFARG